MLKFNFTVMNNKSLLFIFLLCAVFVLNANAATFTVNNNLDTTDAAPGDGICADAIANCTLRAAIEESNALAGTDIINFSLSTPVTILLTLGELPITSDITVNGSGAANLTVSGNGASRVFNITSGTVNINNLAVIDGSSGAGAGINIVASNVTLDTLIIRNNTATGSVGGGIAVNSGTLNLTNSTVGGTGAGQPNTALTFGGGVYSSSSNTTLTNSSIIGNTVTLNQGAGVYFDGGTNSITGSTIANNSTTSTIGAGIFLSAGTLSITTTTIRDNIANGNNGGGLAIAAAAGPATLLNSTVSGNSSASSGGGISNSGTLEIANSTISNNSTVNLGGGIINFAGGTLTLNNLTVSNNSANTDGGITVIGGTVNIRNTIVAQNTAPTNPDVNGTFNTLGNNLIGINNGATVSFPAGTPNGNGDFVGTSGTPLNPQLGPLQANGGPTATRALLPGSTAINNGNNCVVTATCPSSNPPVALTTDQRGAGFPRQLGGNVDIGAFELPGPTAASVTIGGRVFSPAGSGIGRARLVLTDSTGNSRTISTNTFGYYRFNNVQIGETYTISVFSKQYVFMPRVVAVNDELSDLDFVAEP